MSKKRSIVLDQLAPSATVVTGEKPQGRAIPTQQVKSTSAKWSFGFQYFSQIKYFQVGGENSGWFVSFLYRLQQFCGYDKEKFLKDISQKESARYHVINWNSKNVPIARKDLNWLPKVYLDNEDEYPMLQFHVSKALGRIVGFWDGDIFQIVLLDPKHNIQPSNYNSYHVDDTYPMSCEYSSLLIDINKVQGKIGKGKGCEVCSEISKLPTKLNKSNIVFFTLDDDYIEALNKTDKTLKEIIEMGITYLD